VTRVSVRCVGTEFETVYSLEAPVIDLPEIGKQYSWQEVLEIARDHGMDDVVAILTYRDPPNKPFKSDGCSGGCPESWNGHCITDY